MSFRGAELVSYYRVTLPAVVDGVASHEGTWHAVLEVDRARLSKYLSSLDNQPELLRAVRHHGLRYSLSAQTYSNLRMRARLTQDSFEPGATLALRAVLTEYGLPVDHRATTLAEVRRPDDTTSTLLLHEAAPGAFEASFAAPLPGVYRCRLQSSGATLRGEAFTRETTLTGSVWRGGDDPPPNGSAGERDEQLCRLLDCLLDDNGLEKLLRRHEIDSRTIRRCIRQFCQERTR